MTFEWDPAKSASNLAKHGIDFAAAQGLWQGPVLVIPSRQSGEPRRLAIGLLEGRHWTIIFTMRGRVVRLISARRSHANEKAAYRHFLARG